jgi:hypothetical protein
MVVLNEGFAFAPRPETMKIVRVRPCSSVANIFIFMAGPELFGSIREFSGEVQESFGRSRKPFGVIRKSFGVVC